MKPKLKKLRKLRTGNKTNNGIKKSNYKLKVKSSAKKRFSLTATGLVRAPQANKRHNMRKRSARQIREQRGTTILVEDAPMILKVCNLALH
ncbi:MAG: 50S ribosomal protein L35 [Rickettsiales bacterium]|nr:50S ribosomal protein L35 [Rickettsiales bacterium]